MPLITRSGKGSKLTASEMDSNLLYLESLGGTSSGTSSNFYSTTYADLVTTMTNNGLVKGSYYEIIDFKTCYDQPDFDYNGIYLTSSSTYQQGPEEPIIVFSTSENTIGVDAYQAAYPKDTLKYDISWNATEITGSTAFGRITERKDQYNNRTNYDHRNILFKRYRSYNIIGSLSGLITVSDFTVVGTQSSFITEVSVNSYILISDLLYQIDSITDDNNMSIIGHHGIYIDNTKVFICDPAVDYVDDEDNTIWHCYEIKQNNIIGDTYSREFKTFQHEYEISEDYGISSNNYIGDCDFNNQFILANNVFGIECSNNTIGPDSCNNNFIRTDNNKIGSGCKNNIIRNDFEHNSIGDGFENNLIFGDFEDNTIHSFFYDNITHNDFEDNEISNYFENNLVFDNFEDNRVNSFFYNNFITYNFDGNSIGSNFANNRILAYFFDNKVGSDTNDNTIYYTLENNVIGNNFEYNTVGILGGDINISFTANKIGNNFKGNSISIYFERNIIGEDFTSNDITGSFINNIFGNTTLFNNFNSTEGNIFGNDIYSNDLGSDFSRNKIGNNFDDNSIGVNCIDNIIGDDFEYNTILDYCQNNNIGLDFYSNTIANYFENNKIGNNYELNNIGDNVFDNTFGNNIQSNTFGNTFENNNCYKNIAGCVFGTGCNNNEINTALLNSTFGSSFRQNTILASNATTNYTTYTHLYNDYTCFIKKGSDASIYLEYFDGTNNVYEEIV